MIGQSQLKLVTQSYGSKVPNGAMIVRLPHLTLGQHE